MTNQNHQILGNKKRTSRFNPDLAEQINKAVERGEFNPQHTPEGEETPKDYGLEELSILQGDLAQQIHEAVVKKYPVKAITKISYDKGSNPFYVVAVNEELRKRGLRTATLADLETNLQKFQGFYVDAGLVWRSNQAPNEYWAKDLFNQFKSQGKNLTSGTPHVILLRNLSLRRDANSEYELSFVLSDNFNDYFKALILNEPSQQMFKSEDIDKKTGIPTKLSKDGPRKLYTRNWKEYGIKNSGLLRAYLYRGSDLGSDYPDLAGSNDYGRVVVAKPRSG